MLHQVFNLAEFVSTLVTFVFFKHTHDPLSVAVIVVDVVVAQIPALSTQIAFYLPSRLGVVKEHPQFVIAYCAKIHFFVIIDILFLIARFA